MTMRVQLDARQKCDVAVITVNFNSSSHTIACVESIQAFTNTRLDVKIVVIDNNSSDDDFEQLKSLRNAPRVMLHRSPQNIGFASANMLALQFVLPEYVFFLNNDCTLKNDAASILVSFMQKHAACSMCCGLLTDEHGYPVKSWDYFPDVLPKIFGKALYRLTRLGHYRNPKVAPCGPQKVEVISGSQMFIRMSVFSDIGGFDTNFFLYCEEEDLAARIARRKGEVWIVPEARVHHIGGASTRRSLEIRREFLISLLYFYRKNYGFLASLSIRIIYFLRYAKKAFHDSEAIWLSIFLLIGPQLHHSMRHSQKISSINHLDNDSTP
jgi:GT2 family glycosyltransferase